LFVNIKLEWKWLGVMNALVSNTSVIIYTVTIFHFSYLPNLYVLAQQIPMTMTRKMNRVFIFLKNFQTLISNSFLWISFYFDLKQFIQRNAFNSIEFGQNFAISKSNFHKRVHYKTFRVAINYVFK